MVLLTFLLSLFFTSLEAATEPTLISIDEVTEELIEAFWAADLGDCIIVFPEGTSLPIHFLVRGNYFRLALPENPPPTLEVLKTFYIKLNYGEIKVSQDLVHWQGLYEALYLFLLPGMCVTEEGIEITIAGELSLRLK